MQYDPALSQPVTFTELVTRTARQDWPFLVAATAGFFIFQFTVKFLMNKFNRKFRSLSEDDKNTWVVRSVACLNSVLCLGSVVTQFQHGMLSRSVSSSTMSSSSNNSSSSTSSSSSSSALSYFTSLRLLEPIPSNHIEAMHTLYTPLPGQKFFSELITSYFIYDTIVSWYWNWGWEYIVHGIVSGWGVYSVCWSFTDLYAGYMMGPFEASNMFLHGAEMMTMLEFAPILVVSFKAIFSILFLTVRPVCGTIVAVKFTQLLATEISRGYKNVHHPFAVWTVLFVTWGLMALQYLWTKTVVMNSLATLGLVKGVEMQGDAKSPTNKLPASGAKNGNGNGNGNGKHDDSFPTATNKKRD